MTVILVKVLDILVKFIDFHCHSTYFNGILFNYVGVGTHQVLSNVASQFVVYLCWLYIIALGPLLAVPYRRSRMP